MKVTRLKTCYCHTYVKCNSLEVVRIIKGTSGIFNSGAIKAYCTRYEINGLIGIQKLTPELKLGLSVKNL